MSCPLQVMLPTEVWTLILAFSSRASLAATARLSRSFLQLTRPILYQSVYLKSGLRSIEATYDLLFAQPSLIRKITQLQLWTRSPESQWLDLRIFEEMSNLRSLRFIRCPFQDVADQLEFCELVRERCPLLKEFVYDDVWSESSFPDGEFYIENLERLSWTDRECGDWNPVFNVALASLQTLRHLTLPGGTHDSSLSVLEHEFPSLTSFEILPWSEDDIFVENNFSLTSFVVSHMRLTDLRIGYSCDRACSLELLSPSLTSEILPSLQILHADVRILTRLARAGVRSLSSITELKVGNGCLPDSDAYFQEMITALVEVGGLPGLQVLVLEAGGEAADEAIYDWVGGLVGLCKAVQDFSGVLPKTSSDILSSILAILPELKTVTIPWRVAPHQADEHAVYAYALARNCRSLESVTAGERIYRLKAEAEVRWDVLFPAVERKFKYVW